jgi:hypothetical protein
MLLFNKMAKVPSVYKNYVAKSVFVWICIVLMCIGFIWTIINTKQKGIVSSVKRRAFSAITGTVADTVFQFRPMYDIYTMMKSYGGYIVFLGSWFALCLIEALWRPYGALKDVNNKEIQQTIEQKNK